jgi:tetratricopeptide (TPR) repeat protein
MSIAPELPGSSQQLPTPHNLGLYRLRGFTGYRRELMVLHEWLTGGDDLPAIAISGEQGNGKSSLATAAAWSHFHHFTDGIVRVSAAGSNPFRLYDVVRVLDSVLGTALTRTSEEHWGIGILEQLYKRKRLLIIDKLAGATERELATLVDIIGHLHENAGNSRILLIDRNFQPAIANLVKFQHLHLDGIDRADIHDFMQRQAPDQVRQAGLAALEEEFVTLTNGRPLTMRLILGLMLDLPWAELRGILREMPLDRAGSVHAPDVAAFAIENAALNNPDAAVLLSRLVQSMGGVSPTALRELCWQGLGDPAQVQDALDSLRDRALVEVDFYRDRIYLHPTVRAYLGENAVMLGQDWERKHAAYYLHRAEEYQSQPLERWGEIDVDWGNIFVGADWCARRVEQIFSSEGLALMSNPELDRGDIRIVDPGASADLRLVLRYGMALADYAFWRHPPGSIRWLAGAGVAAMALGDMRSYGWVLLSIGRQLFFMDEVQEAVKWMERALPVFDQRDQLAELAYVLTDLGTAYRILDDPRKALAHFLAAFDCVAQRGDRAGLATAYMNLGSAYFSLNQHERALAEQRKALRMALRENNRPLIASTYNNIGLTLEGMERFDEALEIYRAALAFFDRLGDLTGVSACYNNLGSVSYARGDYAAALSWYEKDMALLEGRGAWTDLAATLHNMGHVASEQNDLETAKRYFERSRDLYAAFDLHEYVEEENAMLAYLLEQS